MLEEYQGLLNIRITDLILVDIAFFQKIPK